MALDPTITTALAHALETGMNAALTFDPGTRQQLTRLEGQILQISSTRPSASLYLNPVKEQLHVYTHWAGESTVTLQGNLFNILGLLTHPSPSLASSGVSVTGKVSVLGEYQHLLHHLDIDWEDALASLLGDLPAHQLANTLRHVTQWIKPRQHYWPQFIGEFITEELRAVPAKAEVSAFNRNVDDVRQATDRLLARADNLLNTHPQN